jgi:hypothetical protein
MSDRNCARRVLHSDLAESRYSAWMRLAIFETMNGGERDQQLWFIIDESRSRAVVGPLGICWARLSRLLSCTVEMQMRWHHGHRQMHVARDNSRDVACARAGSPRTRAGAGQRRIRKMKSSSSSFCELSRCPATESEELQVSCPSGSR